MQIEIGKYYVNKTWKYLLPCLKEYGPVFTIKVDTLYKLAAGIGDGLLINSTLESEKLIYILIDRRYNYKITNNIMTWLRYQKQTVIDYPYDNAEGGRKHMFVIRLPSRYHDAYDRFIEGKYSEMYTDEQIDTLYLGRKEDHGALDVFKKTMIAKEKFAVNLHNSFGVAIDLGIEPDAELDFPIQYSKEVFNHEFINK